MTRYRPTWTSLAFATLALGALASGCKSGSDAPPATVTDASDATVHHDADAVAPDKDGAATDDDGAPDNGIATTRVALVGGVVVGIGPRTVVMEGTEIVSVELPEATVSDGFTGTTVDVSGRWITPSFIDSHVHAIYRPATAELARGGLSTVADHAAPTAIFTTSFGVPNVGGQTGDTPSLRVLAAGPMVTPLGGYPTQSWGSNGYGIECADLPSAKAAIDTLKAQGAHFIKVPVGVGPSFPPATLQGIVDHAHISGLKVSTHATSAAAATDAAAAGCDVLAHTPTETLSDATVEAWSAKHVISTLAAFGGSATTIDNLKRLRAAGATVLYGTDYGNTTLPGIDPNELALLKQAGLDGADILIAGTTAAAQFWGLSKSGTVAQGFHADLLVLDADPGVDPTTLTRPVQVYLGGQPLRAMP